MRLEFPFLVCLLDLLIKSSALLLVAFAVRALLRRASAAMRCAILLAGLIATLLLPATKLATPLWRYQWKPVDKPAVLETKVVIQPASNSTPAASDTAPAASRQFHRDLQFNIPAPLFWLWLAGSSLLLARRLLASLQLRALVKGSQPLAIHAPHSDFIQALTASTAPLGGVPILVTKQAAVPLAAGILRPRILLPESALTWTQSRLKAALLHEAAHVVRRDCLARWIADLAFAIYWLNPLAWAARRALILEQEQASDDFALRRGTDPADYATQLLEIVRGLRMRHPQSALAMAHPSTLESRVRAIVDDSRDRRSLKGIHLLLGIASMAAALSACCALQLSSSKRTPPKQPAAHIAAPQAATADLKARVKKVEQNLTAKSNSRPASAEARRSALKERVRKRFNQDRNTYSTEEFSEIERLYQFANKQLDGPEAQQNLKALIEKYPKSNRAGCAVQYLAQKSSGEERENYLKQAIKDFGGCYYGDGVQVGAYARLYLAAYFEELGKKEQAKALHEEIRNDYPDAVNHDGTFLIEILPK